MTPDTSGFSVYSELQRAWYEIQDLWFDAELDEENPTSAKGLQEKGRIRDDVDGVGKNSRLVLRFRIPESLALGPGAKLLGLLLWLRTNSAGGAGAATKKANLHVAEAKWWVEPDVTWDKYEGLTAWTTAGGDYGQRFNVRAIAGTAQVPGGSGGEWQWFDLTELVAQKGAGPGAVIAVELKWDDETSATHKVEYYLGNNLTTQAGAGGWPGSWPFPTTDFIRPTLELDWLDVPPEPIAEFTVTPAPDDPRVPVFSFPTIKDYDFKRLHIRYDTTAVVKGDDSAATLRGWGASGVTDRNAKTARLEAATNFFGAAGLNNTYYFRPFVEDNMNTGLYALGGAEVPVTRPGASGTGQNANRLIRYSALLSAATFAVRERVVMVLSAKGDILEDQLLGKEAFEALIDWQDGTIERFKPARSAVEGTSTAPQLTVTVKDSTPFRVGDAIVIFNGTNYDVARIESISGATLSINTDRAGGGNDKKTFYNYADGDPVYTIPWHSYSYGGAMTNPRVAYINSRGWMGEYVAVNSVGPTTNPAPTAVINAAVRQPNNSTVGGPYEGETNRFSGYGSRCERSDKALTEWRWSVHRAAGAEAADVTTTVPYYVHEHTTGGARCDIALQVYDGANASAWVHIKDAAGVDGLLMNPQGTLYLNLKADFVDKVFARPSKPTALAEDLDGADVSESYSIGRGVGRERITYTVKAVTPSADPLVPTDFKTFWDAALKKLPFADELPNSTGKSTRFGKLVRIDRLQPISKGKYEIVFTVSFPAAP